MLYHAIHWNSISIPLCMAYNTIEYNSITWNTMQYNKTAKSGHLGDFRCPQKGQNGPDTRPNCVVIMSLTKRWQLGPNLAPRGPLRTSGAPKRVFWGPNRPFLPVFDHFLELGGSKWAITVLDEQGIPLRCYGHPTSLYLKQKKSLTKLGRGNLGIGAK